jgi:hypothetical protein
MTRHKTQQYQQNRPAGIVSISNGKLRLASHPTQQMPIADDTTWKKDSKRSMNSIGMFDNTKESLGDLLEEIHTGKVQLPDLQRSFTWCNEQSRDRSSRCDYLTTSIANQENSTPQN